MRRYRLLHVSFDARPSLLGTEIESSWDADVRANWEANQADLRSQLQSQLGSASWARKERDFVELGQAPWCVAFPGHEELAEVRNTFAGGNYKAAAGAAGALGERVLNMLVGDLRDQFPSPSTQVPRRWSTQWPTLITILSDWGLLDATTADAVQQLSVLRHQALHRGFAGNGRPEAIEAHALLRQTIEHVLGAHAPTRWFIQSHASEALIAAAYQDHPVVQTYYLPASAFVGPGYELEYVEEPGSIGVVVRDDLDYEDREISDEEFVSTRKRLVSERFAARDAADE